MPFQLYQTISETDSGYNQHKKDIRQMFQFQYTKRAGDRRSTDILCAQTFSFDLYQLLNKIKEKRKENVCCVRKQ